MDTQEILDLLTNARDGFQIALTQLGDSDAKKDQEIKELRKANEDIYKRNVDLVRKYGGG